MAVPGSLIVTPRRPLRDGRSGSSSNLSSAPVSEEQKNTAPDAEKSKNYAEDCMVENALADVLHHLFHCAEETDSSSASSQVADTEADTHPAKSQMDYEIEKLEAEKPSFNAEAVEKTFPAAAEEPSSDEEADDYDKQSGDQKADDNGKPCSDKVADDNEKPCSDKVADDNEKQHILDSQPSMQSMKSLIDNQIEKSLSENYRPETSSNKTSLSFLEKFSVFERSTVCSPKEDRREVCSDTKRSPETSRFVEHEMKSVVEVMPNAVDEELPKPVQLDEVHSDEKLSRETTICIEDEMKSLVEGTSNTCDEGHQEPMELGEVHSDKKLFFETAKCLEHESTSLVEGASNATDEEHQKLMSSDKDLESTVEGSDTDAQNLNRPVYVPIRERIRSSCRSVSDDCDEWKPPACELAEEVFRAEGSDTEVSCSGQSSAFSEDRTDAPKDRTAGLSMPVPNTGKEYSERITKCWDFLSRNSDFYENNRLLHQETAKLLQDSCIPESVEFEATKSIKKKSLKFDVSAQKPETVRKYKERKSRRKGLSVKTDCKGETGTSKEHLTDSASSESYAQFSASVQKRRQGSSSKTVESSLISAKGKSSGKKTKGKGKSKMEFSFAEPLSPADPEILEALSTPHESYVNSFMFSPPLTRGKLRKKISEDTSNSSFASFASETSFAKKGKPPVDPILEEIMAEKSTDPKPAPNAAATKQAKSKGKKVPTRKPKSFVSCSENTDSAKAKPKSEDSNSPAKSKAGSTPKSSPSKHSMVLRHAKPKTDPF